jgi:hypothetical protein
MTAAPIGQDILTDHGIPVGPGILTCQGTKSVRDERFSV